MNLPKVSVNQIGEYLEANPTRRKRIVHDAKYPKNFITQRYSDAKRIIKQYILSKYDDNILINSIKQLENKKTDTPIKEQDRMLSIELLKGLQCSILPNLDGFIIEKFKGKNRKVTISGIQISINPDFIIRGKYRGQKVVGAIKLSVAKGRVLSKNSANTITVLLKDFLEKSVVNDDEVVKSKFCLSVDVFRNCYFSAPIAYKRKFNHISTACEEIAMRWKEMVA